VRPDVRRLGFRARTMTNMPAVPFKDVRPALTVHDLGRMPYGEALALQRRLLEAVVAGRRGKAAAHLLLVEHDPPVITISRRRSARDHLTASPALLERHGVEVAETDRGGDITYHGPGQLVVYPILDLNALDLRLHGYMRLLEEIVIEILAVFGIEGVRDPGATGVWVRDPRGRAQTAKICAMGVRVSRWVAMHGLALNVDPNLGHFDLIVPCGLAGRPVTSMREVLAGACPPMDAVKATMAAAFARRVAAPSITGPRAAAPRPR
jgi:lipoyl(octanoyl) transferase